MKLHFIISGLMLILMACANPHVSELHEEGEGDALVQQGCGRYIVPNVVEAVGIQATAFGVPVKSVTFEGMDCYEHGSLALNAFSEHQQVVVNGTPVQLFVRNNNLVAVANENIVGQQPLQIESYGEELGPTGRWLVPVDDKTVVQGEVLNWAL